MRTKRTGFMVGAAVVGMAATAYGQAAPAAGGSELDQVRAELRATRAELEQLRGEVRGTSPSGDTWMTEQRRAEVRAIVREVLANADTQPSMSGSTPLAGYGEKGFYLMSADKNYVLRISGQLSARYIANNRNSPPDPVGVDTDGDGTPDRFFGGDENETGFTLRRAKLFFEGNAISPKLGYKLQIAANRDTGALELEEGYISYDVAKNFKVFGGRFTDPFLRDQSTSNKVQLAVERSITSYIFAGSDDYTDGAGFDWRPIEMLRLRGSVNDGISSGVPGGTSPGFLNGGNDFQNDATDIAFTGRADVKLRGKWAQAEDYSAWSGEPLGVFIGGAVHYEIGESGDNQVSSTTSVTGPYDDFITYSLDGSVEYRGLNLFAAGIGQHINATSANANGDLDNYGAVVQAGYMVIPDKLEPFVRYEYVRIDPAVATDDLNLVTAGFNYYFKKHAAKFSLDAVWALEPLTAGNTLGAALTGSGLLNDSAGQDNQFAIRAQFQLLF